MLKKKLIAVLIIVLASGLAVCTAYAINQAPKPEKEQLAAVERLDQAKALWQSLSPKVAQIYNLFMACGVEADWENLVTDDEGNQYAPLAAPFSSVKNLCEFAEVVFTKEYLERELYPWGIRGERPMLKDIGGSLCIRLADGPGLPALDVDSMALEKAGENEVLLIMDAEGEGNYHQVYITLKRQNGVWLVDRMDENIEESFSEPASD